MLLPLLPPLLLQLRAAAASLVLLRLLDGWEPASCACDLLRRIPLAEAAEASSEALNNVVVSVASAASTMAAYPRAGATAVVCALQNQEDMTGQWPGTPS